MANEKDVPKTSVKMHEWQGRTILHPSHANELERESALLEYGHKLPRDQAEDQAHKAYVKKHREAAAAHHLKGAQAAQAVGDTESAKKHGIMYSLHVKALGHEPVGPVHPDIKAAGADKSPYKFKAHKSDLYALDEMKPKGNSEDQPVKKSEALYTIYQACEALKKSR